MYICQRCDKVIGPRVQQVATVLATRPREYHNTFTRVDDYGNKKHCETHSVGREIVREVRSCPECAEVEPNISQTERKGAYGFQEPQAKGFTTALVYNAIQRLLKRVDHTSKRAARDFAATATPLNQWVNANKEFVF